MSINFNDVDYLGAQFLDLKDASLSVDHGYARCVIDDHPFHFNRVPQPEDWAGSELKFKDKDAIALDLTTPIDVKGHLFTVFSTDKFAILFIERDAATPPYVLRVGLKPDLTEVA